MAEEAVVDASAILTLRTAANIWQCDHQGHMNTRHIEGLFDDATANFVANRFGAPNELAGSNIGWADRKHTFEFFKEIRSGDPLDVFTHIVREGARSLTLAHRMMRSLDSATVATAEIVTVCFDLRERRARQLPAKGSTIQPGK